MAPKENNKIWIPVDVKIHWFSFLPAADLARCSRVCRSWVSLCQKTADASIVELTGAQPPQLSRGAKLKFYHRLQNATAPENMGYLLSWAAGSREYTPFLHKLLLLRDTIREDFGLPGGLHDVARPDAYSDADEDVRALFTYRGGAAGHEPVHQHPLVIAASRGNVDAVHLLLLFGEGVHSRASANSGAGGAAGAAAGPNGAPAPGATGPKRGRAERALYVAVEQGNVAVVAALLGRVPLRPPRHPPHVAERLGLMRPVWDVYGPGHVYQSGVNMGPRDVAGAIASARMRAELAAATGFTTAAGQVKASASAALSLSAKGGAQGGAGSLMGPVEAQVSQLMTFESDGRYRAWCYGYRMGTYWATFDGSLANWEALHGPLGGTAGPEGPGATPSAGGSHAAAGAGGAFGWSGGATSRGPGPKTGAKAKAVPAGSLITTSLYNLSKRLDQNVAPGTSAHGSSEGVTPAVMAQGLLVSRLPSNMILPSASRPRGRGLVHPRIPSPIDYGLIASEAIAVKVRLNMGPGEGRTPLWAACELGRLEISYLLLSHHAPALAAAALVPDLPTKEDEADGPAGGPAAPAGPAGPAPGAPGGPPLAALPGGNAAAGAVAGAAAAPGAPAAQPAAIEAPPDPAAQAAAAALACVAGMSVPALAIPPDYLYLTSTASDPALTVAGPADGSGVGSSMGSSGAAEAPAGNEWWSAAVSSLGISTAASGSSYGASSPSGGHGHGSSGVLHPAGLVACPASSYALGRREEVLAELMGEARDRADVEMCPPGQHSPLGLACERGDPLLVQMLLHWGADVNRPGKKDAPPVLTAAMAHHEAVLRVLLRAACAAGPAKEVAAVIDELRAKRGLPPMAQAHGGDTVVRPGLGAVGGLGATLRRSYSADSDLDGEGTPSAGSGAAAGLGYGSSAAVILAALRASSSGNNGSGGGQQGGLFQLLGLTGPSPALRSLASQGRSSVVLRSVLAASGCGPLRRTLTEGYRLEDLKDKGTAATNAMGSTIANQRRKTGGKAAREREGRPEDVPLDLCEPSVVAALAAAAAAAGGGLDEFGTPLPQRPAPIDMSLFLPADEAAAASGDGQGGPSALSYYKTGAVGTKLKLGGGAGGGRLAALLAQHRAAMSSVSVIGGLLNGSKDGSGASGAAAGADDSDGGVPAEEVLSYATSTSYVELQASVELFKRGVRAAASNLARRSRICAGVGALDGRPSLDVNIGDESGYTPLFIMASAGRLETVMLLIAAGSDPTLPTKRGKTPIYGAVEKQHEDVVEFLMTRYSALQLRANTTYGTNVLHAAQKCGNSRIRDLLNMYCIEYDEKMRRVGKAEAAARRKAQWGDGEDGAGGAAGGDGDGDLAVGGQAAEHLRKLRAAAEAAKRREAEAASSRRMGIRAASLGPGGSAGASSDTEGGEEDDGPGRKGAGGRGRSRARRASSGAGTEGTDDSGLMGAGGGLPLALQDSQQRQLASKSVVNLDLSPYKAGGSGAAAAAGARSTSKAPAGGAGKPPKSSAAGAAAAYGGALLGGAKEKAKDGGQRGRSVGPPRTSSAASRGSSVSSGSDGPALPVHGSALRSPGQAGTGSPAAGAGAAASPSRRAGLSPSGAAANATPAGGKSSETGHGHKHGSSSGPIRRLSLGSLSDSGPTTGSSHGHGGKSSSGNINAGSPGQASVGGMSIGGTTVTGSMASGTGSASQSGSPLSVHLNANHSNSGSSSGKHSSSASAQTVAASAASTATTAAALGSSVFDRLAARARELEAKRKAQEDELHGGPGGSSSGNSNGSSGGTPKVNSDAIDGGTTGKPPAPKDKGQAVPKPGSKPAYLVAYEQQKAAEAAEQAARLAALAAGPSARTAAFDLGRQAAAANQGSSPIRHGNGGGGGNGNGHSSNGGHRAQTADSQSSAGGSSYDSLDLGPVLAQAAAERARRAAAMTTGIGAKIAAAASTTAAQSAAAAWAGGKEPAAAATRAASPVKQTPAPAAASSGAARKPSVGASSTASGGSDGPSHSHSNNAGGSNTVDARGKADADRARRAAFLDRLTKGGSGAGAEGGGSGGAETSAPAAAMPSSSAPSVAKDSPAIAAGHAALSSFEVAAATFAAKRAELDAMLAALDASDGPSSGSGGGAATSKAKVVASPPLRKAASAPDHVGHDSSDGAGAGEDSSYHPGRYGSAGSGGSDLPPALGSVDKSAAVKAKASLLGLGLGLGSGAGPTGSPYGSPAAAAGGSSGSGSGLGGALSDSSSPFRGLLTRGLNLGLGQHKAGSGAAAIRSTRDLESGGAGSNSGSNGGGSGARRGSKDHVHSSGDGSHTTPAAPAGPSREEVAAREERNRAREAARLARIERAREEAEARRLAEEDRDNKGTFGAPPPLAAPSALKLAVAAYGSALGTKKKR